MTRNEFISRLSYLLQDLPDSEREEALQYYNDYFDEAGPEREESLIEEWGTPERAAAMLKEGLSEDGKDLGEFTENGFGDSRYRENNQVPETKGGTQKQYQSRYPDTDWIDVRSQTREENPYYTQAENQYRNYQGYTEGASRDDFEKKEQQGKPEQRKQRNLFATIVLIILAVICLPVVVPVVIGVLAAVFGVVAAIIVTGIALLIAAVAITIAGICCVCFGIVNLFITGPSGIMMLGAGFLLTAIGLLGTVLTAWLCGKFIPMCIRGFVSICSFPFRKRGEYR